MKSAEEVLDIIKNQMENEERYKLLTEMFYLYYNNRGFERMEYEDE